MRKSLITIAGLAAAGIATVAGLTGCGGSHLAGAAVAPVTASPSAAEAVLTANYFAQDQGIAFGPGMTGIASAARGFNGNAEQVAAIYRTAADAQREVSWYQGAADTIGGGAVVQASGAVITVTGDDVHMATYLQQITGYNLSPVKLQRPAKNQLAGLWRACGAVTGLRPVSGSRSGRVAFRGPAVPSSPAPGARLPVITGYPAGHRWPAGSARAAAGTARPVSCSGLGARRGASSAYRPGARPSGCGWRAQGGTAVGAVPLSPIRSGASVTSV